MNGKVWLVGAGPGDAGLLTRKGYQVLREAEVVIYDSLVSDSILCMIPNNSIKIDAGKRAGNHKIPQEETNRLILKYAQKGYRVVRLKGGDPFLFGRGGEELELLVENNIEYEIVPGVTSAIAVPAYNGIPVTHRNLASSVHIITAHHKDDRNNIDYERLVKIGGTFVFLMGFSELENIIRGLSDAGISLKSPVAVLSQGTTSKQSRVVGTIADICSLVKASGMIPPAIVVVGEVCSLANDFAWWEKLPLAGIKILLTRPQGRMDRLTDMLAKLGAQVVGHPASVIEPVKDNKPLLSALRSIEDYNWLVFTSPSGVEVFFELLSENKYDIRKLSKIKIAAIGDGTRRILLDKGIIADCVPDIYDGKSLGRAIANAAEPGDKILLARARIGNEDILNELQGFEVDDIPIYDTVANTEGVLSISDAIVVNEFDYVIFTSSSSVRFFAEYNDDIDYEKINAVCIGNKTAETASSFGMNCVVAKEASVEGIVNLILDIRK